MVVKAVGAVAVEVECGVGEELDRAAFEAVYRSNSWAVYTHFLQRGVARADADDLTAEVFAIAWRRRNDIARHPTTVMAGPRLHHPYRDYLLLTGPLDAATDLGYWPTTDWFIPQSPNLIWPSDHSWCVAPEIDFRFTLVGGNTDLIDAIVADPTVEAWPVGAADYL